MTPISEFTKLQFEDSGRLKILSKFPNFSKAAFTRAISDSVLASYSKPTISAPGIKNSKSMSFPSIAIFNSPTPCSCLSTCLVSSAAETDTIADISSE